MVLARETQGRLRRRTGSSGGSNSESRLKPSDINGLLDGEGESDHESLVDDASGCGSDALGSDISLDDISEREHRTDARAAKRQRYSRGYPLLVLGASALLIAIWIESVIFPSDPTLDMTTSPVLPLTSPAVSILATVSLPISSMAVSSNGTVYLTFHDNRVSRASATLKAGVLHPDSKKPEPFPSAGFQQVLDNPSAVLEDVGRGWVWILDHGKMGLRHPCLYAYDVVTRKQVHQFSFHKRFAGYLSYYQRMVIDPRGDHIYIADASTMGVRDASLVVYDITRQTARHVLAGHHSTKAKRMHLTSRGEAVTFAWGLVAYRAGVMNLGIDPGNEYLYYSALPDDFLYRIPLATLRDEHVSKPQAESQVEVVARMPAASSIVIVEGRTLYLTEPEREAIMRMDIPLKFGHVDASSNPPALETIIRDNALHWPDCLGLSADGRHVYFADTSLGDLVRGTAQDISKYNIYRMSLMQ